MKTNILILLFILSIITNCDIGLMGEPDIHLIPKNYIGKVVISFGDSLGKDAEYQKQNRVFRIGKDGKFATKIDMEQGRYPARFFYFDGKEKKEIPYARNSKQKDSNKVVIQGIYPIGEEEIYFVDSIKNLSKYKNPAIDERENRY